MLNSLRKISAYYHTAPVQIRASIWFLICTFMQRGISVIMCTPSATPPSWMEHKYPEVLMTAYAVRGLDINTSYTIYNLLTEQKMKGVAVVYVGEDLDVLLELADRILEI